MRKISRSQLRAFAIAHTKSKQDGKCAICQKPIDFTVMGRTSDYVVDHNHDTGEIRGVLHRSCNASEGRVANAAGRWGAKSMQYSEIIPYLRSLVEYLEYHQANPSNLLYPDHKTPEEKASAARLKRNKANAAKRARERAILRKDKK